MKKLTAWALLLSTWFTFVAPVATVNGQVTGRAMEDKMKDVPNGLTFRLSEGVEGAEKRVKTGLPSTDPLSQTDANGILKRLPGIKSDPDDQTDFAKSIGSLPAPKAGNKIPVKFPSDDMRAAPAVDMSGKTLEVLRYSPEGEVTLAPDLSVTFSQPMVAVSSQEQAAQVVPVELSPQVPGRWRWLGTKTLMFDTDKRFPQATKFTVRVPKGTKSATGQTLQKDVTWTFTTPPPKVEQFYPGNGATTRRDTLMYLQFDQAITPEAVLRTITVMGAGRRLQTRLATQEEINADSSVLYYTKQAQPGRWLVLRAINSDGSAENALPGASSITVNVQKGTPSAEGPLMTAADQTFSFATYSPLKFNRSYCNYDGSRTCSPFDTWYLEFNNSIDPSKFDKSMIRVEPAVEGVTIAPGGQYIYISGAKKGNTTYKVTIDPSVADIFGQKLGTTATAIFRVGRAEAELSAQGGTMSVLDPTAKSTFSVYSTNYSNVKVRLYAVEPKDWRAFQDYIRHINYDDSAQRPQIPGRLVSDEIVDIANKPDEMVETRIDVSKALNGGFGNVIVDIEPTVKKDKYDRTRVFQWLQSTQIGLDAYVDSNELVGFATEMRTGKPMADVELSIYPNGTGKALSADVETPGGVTLTSVATAVWDWLTGNKASGPSDVTATDESGTAIDAETIPAAQTNKTGDNGILRLELPDTYPQNGGPNMLIARRGKDVAFLPENAEYYYNDQGSWYKKPLIDQLRWFTFDDRRMYKPKEEVSLKGYIRTIQAGKLGDVVPIGAAHTYTWSAKDPRNNEIAKGQVTTNACGAFDLKFKIPDNANLGGARVDFSPVPDTGVTYSHQFQIQEFRRPEFEVSAKVESEAPFFVGSNANLSVQASYYAGGGLANAETNWTVTATPTNYTPPNRDDFVFGVWTPWWGWYDYGRGIPSYGGSTTQTFKGVTDASGKHLLKMDFVSANPPRPYAISAAASVQDVNRQTWSSSTSLLVHPSSLYVGIKTPRTFVQKGENITVESIVSDIDGNLVAGRDAEIKAVLKDWDFDKGSWVEKVVDEQSCTVKSGAAAQKCEFIAKAGGRYTITATVMDDKERYNQSQMTVWVPGGKQPPKRNVEQEQVQIIPSKKDYAPGDLAELLVIAPFTPAEGVLTLRRDGIVKTERFTMKDSSITLKVQIDEKYLPNITAQVDLVGAADRTDDKGEVDPKLAKRPAYASGSLNLAISTASRHLSVDAEAVDKTLAPGAETKVNVDVKDSRGEPVANSEVAVVMVDESVLALSRYTVGEPLDTFYSQRGTGTADYHLRQQVLLANPGDLKKISNVINTRQISDLPINGRATGSLAMMSAGIAAPAPKSGARAADKAEFRIVTKSGVNEEEKTENQPEQNQSAIALRQNFDALALWSPTVKTDSNGHAVVNIKLPDNLTRYRITAVAVDAGNKFGKSESNLTARQPLMVRPSAPRFMNFGDKVDLPIVVQNQTDKDMAVDVAIRATNALLSEPGTVVTGFNTVGKRVLVKANDRVEVRFPVSTVKAGTARFQIAVSSGSYSDAAEISLPVWTPATTEAFATYGTTDQNGAIVQPVQTPGDVFPQFGGLEVTTSSTQLQELTDAYISLFRYPYECSEQISSRMISTAALRDVLTAFKAKEMPMQAELEARFARDIEILQSRQRDDGSFGLWQRNRERYEYPFLTVHVAHALALAKAKGYKVPDSMINKTRPYLKNVESHFDEWYKNSPQVRWTISAYALYVRDMMGDKDTAKAKRLLAEMTGGTKFNGDGTVADKAFEKAPFEALGWVLDVLANDQNSQNEVAAILHHLNNHTTETAATANFVTDYGDGAWLIMYSNRRADGVLLEALLKAQPQNDLIPKLVRGLLDHRVKGAWSNTQENVFILLALDKYFNTYEKVTPDFVSRIWLGNTYAGEQTFKGRSIDSNILNIPMSYLTDQGGGASSPVNLIIDREGAGRLYYRIGMTYAPKNLKLDPADYGFTVLRSYEPVDDKDDVKQNADGSWTIKSGARVRIRLTMVAQARRYHVALVDQLPAGLEILNPELATTEAIPADQKPATSVLEYGSRSYGYGSWWWRQYWFEHQNFRDERAEAFASLLWEGVYNYSYVTRATTPGKFVVPPAKAEEMYHPETFGRTGTDFVTVE